MNEDIKRISTLARTIRRHAIQMTHRGHAAHVGSSLSMADLLAVLYGGVLAVDPKNPSWPDRDRFILSKGHACAGTYAALAETGFFPLSWLESFYTDGAKLTGHLTTSGIPGVELSTGSLGHGLPVAGGMALVGKRDGHPWRVFALLSDGECDEGSTWEAILFAGHNKLDNLTAIIDYNGIQSLGRTSEIMELEPFAKKWEDFGWAVREVGGHDIPKLLSTLGEVPFAKNKPSVVIAKTIKGKGVSFMEDSLLWHYRNPSKEEMELALKELEEGA